ncbi:MAG: hypothetical protein P8Z80_16800 [Pseudolabrys sp.]
MLTPPPTLNPRKNRIRFETQWSFAMATSQRARLRAPANPYAPSRAPTNRCAPENPCAPDPAPEQSPPKRGWPAPVVYTEEALAEARRRYEHTDESLTSIAAGLGTSARTLQRIARPEGWERYVPPPRDATPAARLLMEARALEERASGDRHPEVAAKRPSKDDSPCVAGADGRSSFEARPLRDLAPQDDGEGESATAPDDTAVLLDRLTRAVVRELAAVEAMRAEMKSTPQRPRDAIATAQTLSSLTETLNKLQRMRCGLADQDRDRNHDDSDDLPSDIDARRDALARRIEAFMASRPDADDAAGVERERPDGA